MLTIGTTALSIMVLGVMWTSVYWPVWIKMTVTVGLIVATYWVLVLLAASSATGFGAFG